MKIAIAVHGRFHAFALACGLIQRGHEVTVLTNYPKWAAERFGVPRERVRSFWVHGVLSRMAWRVHETTGAVYPEAWLHPLFGRWVAREVAREHFDVVHAWSGVAEESLRVRSGHALHLLMRGSAHIRAQARLLCQEEERTHTRQDKPSEWIILREEREYALAESVVTLSTFALKTFIDEGVDAGKLSLQTLAANTRAFRPSPQVIEERRRRILTGEPLRVLFVGALSFQKGMWDMREIVRILSGSSLQFRFVGPQAPEVKAIVASMRHHAEFVPKQPQNRLPESYAWGDLFMFPTIQDGFAQVLTQAGTSGLPILTTTNSGGPDFIHEGETGWILPIRSPAAFVDRLRWCDSHRKDTAAMVERIYHDDRQRDWADVAADFERICRDANGRSPRGRS